MRIDTPPCNWWIEPRAKQYPAVQLSRRNLKSVIAWIRGKHDHPWAQWYDPSKPDRPHWWEEGPPAYLAKDAVEMFMRRRERYKSRWLRIARKCGGVLEIVNLDEYNRPLPAQWAVFGDWIYRDDGDTGGVPPFHVLQKDPNLFRKRFRRFRKHGNRAYEDLAYGK